MSPESTAHLPTLPYTRGSPNLPSLYIYFFIQCGGYVLSHMVTFTTNLTLIYHITLSSDGYSWIPQISLYFVMVVK